MLDLAAVVGKKPVAETTDDDFPPIDAFEKRISAPMNLIRSLAISAEDCPADFDSRQRFDQPKHGSAATDLDVIRVTPDREDAAWCRDVAELDFQHGGDDSVLESPSGAVQTSHGGRPDAASASRLCLSFSVSMGAQNPS